ncbi:ATP-binding cassette domain-containing protein [Jeotgalibacillus soli]|uniref:ATP-binding cassette domain-containing protein n=1 Tax=Jeotgalibacillus soli TaxID=889306 RepID=UPI000698EEA4|nr:ATP-binding cassette domain-containing protein [Jeotgalibacillus soli]
MLALDSVDIKLELGKVYGLLGSNGNEKSTLLKMVAGLVRPTEGTVLLDGDSVSRLKDDRIAYLSGLDHLNALFTIQE